MHSKLHQPTTLVLDNIYHITTYCLT